MRRALSVFDYELKRLLVHRWFQTAGSEGHCRLWTLSAAGRKRLRELLAAEDPEHQKPAKRPRQKG
jgi:hypothetical protein